MIIYNLIPDNFGPLTVYSGSDTLELGTRFVSDRDGWLLGIRFYRDLSLPGPFTARLWQQGNLIAQTQELTSWELGWINLYFDIPPRIKVGQEYTVSYSDTQGHFTYRSGGPSPATAGDLAYVGSVYGATLGQCPTQPITNFYAVDPLVCFDPPKVHLQLGADGAPPAAYPDGTANNLEVITAAGSNWGPIPLPWSIPSGWDYCITDVIFSTKNVWFADGSDARATFGERNSYLHLADGSFTITSRENPLHLGTPFILPSGFEFSMSMQNGATEVQNMTGLVMGFLYPAGMWHGDF